MPSEQYRVGHSSVTPGQQTVSGYSTSWSTEVLAGDVYKPDVDTEPTQVIGTVVNDTTLTLSANWAGTTHTYQTYMIQRSWTPNKNLARPYQGDADLADMLREQVVDKIDTEMQNPTVTKISGVTYASRPSGTTINNDTFVGDQISGVTFLTKPSGTTITDGQIAFPPTQNASADANTLDDYEEGTWTITITPETSGTVTMESTRDLCAYTKIGRIVHVHAYIEIASVSSPVGDLRFSLPFTSAQLSESAGMSVGSLMTNNINFTGDYINVRINEGLAYFYVTETIDASVFDYLEGADLAGGEYLCFQLTYITN